MKYIAAVLFSLSTLAGTAYLIVVHGWSPWWMALAVLIAL